MGKPILWIVIPCYNEQDVLPETAPMFLNKLNEISTMGLISDKSRILFVNDGSKDSTWDIIKDLSKKDVHYIGICQSRNRGHQNAVLAGLMAAKDHCDITISIDCDGQDDINAMDKMVQEYLEGAEVVYGVRSNRDTDSWFKRNSAQGFYKLLSLLGGDIVYNHADYRLVSSTVLQHFSDYHEVNIFLRGMFPLIGFKSTVVTYERNERIAGKSHYPISKMLALAIDGITSLSIKPIRMVSAFGIIVALLGFIGIVWIVIRAILGYTLAGWASTICIMTFLGGVQLLSIGIVGEYIGKTYMESKHRPRYIISEKTWEKNERHYKG